MNLSALADDAIAVAYTNIARAKWDEEIRQACEVHNRYIAEHGTLSEAMWAMEDEAADGERSTLA
jgi:post-segregation antitoxin (ccd killing protein)